jgi:hypothetical protein
MPAAYDTHHHHHHLRHQLKQKKDEKEVVEKPEMESLKRGCGLLL